MIGIPVKDDYITAAKAEKTIFDVRNHPHSDKHLLLVVIFRGRVYAQTSAYDPDGYDLNGEDVKPTVSTVQYAWRHSRHKFLPYNESTGCYVDQSK